MARHRPESPAQPVLTRNALKRVVREQQHLETLYPILAAEAMLYSIAICISNCRRRSMLSAALFLAPYFRRYYGLSYQGLILS